MINIDMYEVNEACNMVERKKLDVHTATLGISLPEYVNSNLEALSEEIYKKITTLAKNLVSTGQDVRTDFGIPVVDKRTSVTPIVLMGGSVCRRPKDFVTVAKTLNMAVREVGVNFTGGYSVLMNKGMTGAGKDLILSIPQALSQTERVCSSVNVGSTKTGIDMDATELMDRIVTETAKTTRDHDSLGCAKLVMFCNAPDDNPFMTGTFHGVTESEAIIDVDVSGPGVMKVALVKVRDASFEVPCEIIKKAAFRITRMGQLVAQETSRRMGIPFEVIDLSLVPTPSVGGNTAEILEEIGLKRVDAPGATAALAMLNDQVRKGGVVTSSYMGGLNGVFIPVSEDQGMIDAASMGALTVEKLETMTHVCSVSLDMIATPGDTPSGTIAGIITDEVAIKIVNRKTTATHLIPVMGKKVGETAEFGGLPDYVPVMPVNTFSCKRFVTGGGRIPVPIRSFKN